MQTWKNKQGADLPPGSWAQEPDKAHWVDAATGYDCLVVRNSGGALCGYVGVPTGHPWHGVDYSELDVSVDVHGGLTFSGGCGHGEDEAEGICHVPAPGQPDNVWWQGFDCSHAHDLTPRWPSGFGRGVYRTFEYVQAQTAGLALQAARAAG